MSFEEETKQSPRTPLRGDENFGTEKTEAELISEAEKAATTQTTKKRKPRPKFTPDVLLHEKKGLNFVKTQFCKRLRLDQMMENEGNEGRCLKRVVQGYMQWIKMMYPYEPYDSILRKIELMGHRCKGTLQDMRDEEVRRVRAEKRKELEKKEEDELLDKLSDQVVESSSTKEKDEETTTTTTTTTTTDDNLNVDESKDTDKGNGKARTSNDEEYPVELSQLEPRTLESQMQDEDKQFESNMAHEFAMMDDY